MAMFIPLNSTVVYCHLVRPEVRINLLRFPKRKRKSEIRLQWNKMYKLHILGISSGKRIEPPHTLTHTHTLAHFFYTHCTILSI